MSNTKIVIDKEDFEQKIIGWIERRNYVTKSDILALFQDLTTEIQIDQTIEERAEEALIFKFDMKLASDGYLQGAKDQQIIEQLRVKEKEDEKFICTHCGSNKTYKTEAYHCNMCAITTEI